MLYDTHRLPAWRLCSAGSTFLSRYRRKIGWRPFLPEIMMEIIICNEKKNVIPNMQRQLMAAGD